MPRTMTALTLSAALAATGGVSAACGGSSAPSTPGGITQSQPAQGQSQTSKYQLTSEGSQNRWTQAMLNTAMNQFIASGPGSRFTQSQDQCVADYLQTTVTIQPNGFVHPDGTLTDAIATQAYNSCVNG